MSRTAKAGLKTCSSAGVVVLALLLLAACSRHAKPDGREALTIVTKEGTTAKLRVEVAATADQLEEGLTGRTSLPRDIGMLFVIEQRGPGFWMKDTPLALSVAFIGECGEVVALADMQPFSLDFHNTPKPYRFGLEVNQGWFADHEIEVGDQVKIPSQYLNPGC